MEPKEFTDAYVAMAALLIDKAHLDPRVDLKDLDIKSYHAVGLDYFFFDKGETNDAFIKIAEDYCIFNPNVIQNASEVINILIEKAINEVNKYYGT